MKILFRKSLRSILKYLCIIAIKKHSIDIIAVGGWYGTDIAREAVFSVLKHNGMKVRRTVKTPEVDWDIPLSILGIRYLPSNVFEWGYELARSIARLIILAPNPSLLVLQINTHDPGIMKYWMSFVSPKVVIMLNSHVGTLNLELLLVERLGENGYLILNADNVRTKSLAQGKKENVIYFGEKKSVMPDIYYHAVKTSDRQVLTIGDSFGEEIITKFIPEFAYPFVTAGVSVTKCYAINLKDGCEALGYFELPTDKIQNIFHKFIED